MRDNKNLYILTQLGVCGLLLVYFIFYKQSIFLPIAYITIQSVAAGSAINRDYNNDSVLVSVGLYLIMTVLIQLAMVFTIWQLFFDFEVFKAIGYMLVFAANALIFSFIIGEYNNRKKRRK